MGLVGMAAYSEGVKLADFKAAMRRAREATRGSRANLEDETGIDQSTIYRIETDATYDPSISTVATLIHGMGLTLSGFFAEIEARENTRLQSETPPLHNASVRVSSESNGREGVLRAEPNATSESRDVAAVSSLRPVPPPAATLPPEVADALRHTAEAFATVSGHIGTLSVLLAARPGTQAGQPHPAPPNVRRPKPRAGQRRAGTRR